ncbi:MAG TPA: aminomethyl-transferring glycine dehydrogenase [Ignavibacteria bacterium]|nr:aminomethyl-transferring glycine dehydrogenase [Ignavibacteria bacterium]
MNFFNNEYDFQNRHIGPDNNEINEMLEEINCESVDQLINETIPAGIRNQKPLNLSKPLSEDEFLKSIRDIAGKNKIFKSYIGLGYHPTITPTVILRNILSNPGWYTQYTPYQAEIAQGRLEALLNFQTMVLDLTGLQVANASLLDEGTAAAEAMLMFYHLDNSKSGNLKFFVSDECFPQTIEVLKTRALPLNIEIVVDDIKKINTDEKYLGVLVQYPTSDGAIYDYKEKFKELKDKNILIAVASDLLSLTLLTPPGEIGADVVIGSTQRFGVPMGYGGPHAGFFATVEKFKRHIPGRIIGVSIDSNGNRALRMALQTREQHIKRDKATSNICTAQVLLAVMAGMYAVYHGPNGLKNIAEKINKLTFILDLNLKRLGYEQANEYYFDTLKIIIKDTVLKSKIKKLAEEKNINFRYVKDYIGISLNETTRIDDVKDIVNIFADAVSREPSFEDDLKTEFSTIPTSLIRSSDFMFHPVFSSHRSETEMLRYIKSLENKDLSLTHSMIPLGSCTMKLNATTEMIPVTMPLFSEIHPFVPVEQAKGYELMISELEKDLSEITGFSGTSVQPNSGAQGEYAGLLVIRQFHLKNGNSNRNICLIPSSAHGTNPASAVMAGMKVVVVNCDEKGNIKLDDLKAKAEQYKDSLAALMVTYPSTHGVFEEDIKEICQIIHDYGGQVYMDGANMNAQVGLTSPFMIGADVCHLNLHKTFCIPHGGGGPGVGPICVAEHLKEFLPSHPIIKTGGKKAITAVSAAPFGSSSILLISYAYIKMMGAEGLTNATKIAILNANYIKTKLEPYYKILYSGTNGSVAHELIFDMREFKTSAKIEVIDIAKRLIDYGFHAPTVSFPVPGTLMVEPTESESKAELDKFISAMISIRNEIKDIETGNADINDNLLKNSPHTAFEIVQDSWNHPYSRQLAAFPNEFSKQNKFWPSVSRINDAHGDRNLICSCNPISDYVTSEN